MMMVSTDPLRMHTRSKALLPGFHMLVMFVIFTTAFGEVLKHAIGFSPAKLIIPWLFLYLLSVKFGSLKLHPLIGVYSLFVFCTLPSLIVGVDFSSVLLSLIGYIFLFQILFYYSFSLDRIKDLAGAYIAGVFLVSCLTLQFFITGTDVGVQFGEPFVEIWLGFPVVSGPSNNPNGFASLLLPAVPLTLSFLLTSKTKLRKFIFSMVMITTLLTLIVTFSRSAIAASLFACIAVHHCVKNKSVFSLSLFARLLTALVAIIMSASIFLLVIDFLTADVSGMSGEYASYSENKVKSGGYRTLVLIPMVNIAMDNLLIGVGFGNIKPLMEAETGLYINSHNTPFGIFLDYGIFAFIFLCITVAYSCRSYNTAIKNAHVVDDRLLIGSLFTGLGAMIFHGFFHEMYINLMLWFLIGMGPVVKRSIRHT